MNTNESKGTTISPQGVHHVALGAHDPASLCAFYTRCLGAKILKTHRHPDGTIRAIWLTFGPSPMVLMLEATAAARRPPHQGVEAGFFLLALAFSEAARGEAERQLQAEGFAIEDRTEFTSYTRDPEGNRVGLSSYQF